MRLWFDTEFIEDGKTIDLISIGVFSDDKRKYYAEFAECDLTRASPWVAENVLPHLHGQKTPRKVVAGEIVEFMGEKPEIWGYYADYDWVALCQIYGTMMSLPNGWPMYCRDVKQLCDALGNPTLPKQESQKHNALADAIWTAQAWFFLASLTQVNAPMAKQLDIGSHNPRMQCAACGRWMRLHGKRLEAVDGKVTEVAVQRFYGGCNHNNGGGHLAAKNDNHDVCDRCCQIECKAIAEMPSDLGGSLAESAD